MVVLALVSLVVGNTFGIERFGLFAFVLTIYNTLALIGSSSLQTGMLVFTPRHEGDPRRLARYLAASLLVALIGGAVVAAALLVGADPAARLFDLGGLGEHLPKVAVALPLAIVNKVLIGSLLGRHRVGAAASAEVSRMLVLLVVVVVAAIEGRYALLFWAFALADAANLLLLVAVAGLRGGGMARPTWAILSEVVTFARHTALGTVVGQINTSLDVLMVGYFLDARALGIYATAVLFIRAVNFVPYAVQRVYTPYLTASFRDEDHDALARFASSVPKTLGLVVGALLLVIAGGYDQLVTLLFPGNPEYVESWAPFLYLAPGSVILAIAYTVFPIATVSIDHAENVPRIALFGLTSNFIVNVVAIPWLGLIGCALATSVAQLVVLLMVKFYLNKHLGLRGAAIREALVVGSFIACLAICGATRDASVAWGLLAAPLFVVSVVLAKLVGRADLAGFNRPGHGHK